MILSVKHNFIFIRGRKVAGTSVEMALSTLCGVADIASPMLPADERERQRLGGRCGNYGDPLFERAYLNAVLAASPAELAGIPVPRSDYHAHSSLRQIAEAYGAPISGLRVISVERNPYAKVISALNMRRGYAAAASDPRPLAERIGPHFDKAMKHRGLDRLRSLEIYRAPDGKIEVEAMRYENLQADFDAFVRSLGIDRHIEIPHAKKGLMANRIDPASVFRRDQLDAINALFVEEFERFGYSRV